MKESSNNFLLFDSIFPIIHASEGENMHKLKNVISSKSGDLLELSTAREATSYAATGQFPAFHGTRRFITEFTRALHLYLS
jgi:hypothetical protein